MNVQVSRHRQAGDSFFICFSSFRATNAQVVAGRVLAPDRSPADFDPTVPRRHAVIFAESSRVLAGRPAAEGDGVNGEGARVLTVPEWVGVYGACKNAWLYAWVYR